MGIIRKTMSVGSLGAVDFRSDKERIARYTKQTRNAVRAGNQPVAQTAVYSQVTAWNTSAPTAPPGGYPPGWYLDEHDPRFLRWWDVTGPSQHVQPIPDGPPVQLPPPGVMPPAQVAPAAIPPSITDELTRLAELHRSGALSDDEFAAAKARLIG